MSIEAYLSQVQKLFFAGNATEHSYRPALQRLLQELDPSITVTNEPKRVKSGAPDFIITRKQIPLGYIEAKDIVPGILDKKENQKQVKKYFDGGLGYNFIHTDYLEFRFYRNNSRVKTVRIAEVGPRSLLPDEGEVESLNELLRSFFSQFQGQTITSSRKLAEMMAAKARMIKSVILSALQDEEDAGGELRGQFEAFQRILMHDMTEKQFADMYAQTITYGLFAARLHDPTLENFSRMEAAELLPRTNPFLRQLFGQIGALNLDTRLTWIVDDLVEVFKSCNVKDILEDYGKVTQRNDPVVHFYEDFLAEYDKGLRRSRGVWYTPEPVVDFIVRAVDEVLQTEFGLPDGLADTSRVEIEVAGQETDRRYADNKKRAKLNVHRVQILDPATGTGTFLARVIQQAYSRFESMPALWNNYVNTDLLPRLHGFEILMASYAMAHLKLDLVLRELGAEPNRRLSVYLTNSLEEAHPDTGTLFAQWLSQESDEANRIKRDMPIMCVIGNPPYAVSSSNKGEWIQNLIAVYKKDLNERKINLDDDYIKFLRYAEYFIEKNSQGIVAMITNNSYFDGVTHRQMRKHMLEAFDKIYIYNLHGNAKRKETTPEGDIDQNVFDIQQGVGIIVAIKTGVKNKGQLGKVHYYDAWGKRKEKYDKLLKHGLRVNIWKELSCKAPYYFFVPKAYNQKQDYDEGIYATDFFGNYNSGIQTKCDELAIHFTRASLESVIVDFENLTIENLKSKYSKKNSSGWTYERAQSAIKSKGFEIAIVNFRPFDKRYSIYCDYSGGFIGRPRAKTMKHLLKDNYAVLFPRQAITEKFGFFITDTICDINFTGTAGQYGAGLVFPLYVYPETNQLSFDQSLKRKPNLDLKIVSEVAAKLSLRFIPDHELPEAGEDGTFTPLDLLDFIYAVLHSPSYREKYKEFLKIDFPRIPYPEDAELFWKLVKLGRELRGLHLMESSALDKHRIRLDGGDNLAVEKTGSKAYDPETQRVYINDDVYFEGVPELAWEFYIGGYQPAQKWLKDRKGQTLDFNGVRHYMKIIVALVETDRIMQEIDEVKEF